MCFEARDTLFACTDAQENGNKYRCPDELYAYEMWCPQDFRRMHSVWKRKRDLENEIYDKELVDKINSERATISKGHWVQSWECLDVLLINTVDSFDESAYKYS